MKSTRPALLALAVLGLIAVLSSCQNSGSTGGAAVAESKQIFKTYPFGDPDPVPIFARSSLWGAGARLYPYFFFNQFSAVGEDREWTIVRLENPYISLAVLPQVGGKVWGATDKKKGRDFLYTNHVMKFREIALRGPWTSGGIEFNFGIVGHAPSTATPVDYVLRRNPDGSASCVVGALDLPSRTRWSVTIRLPKDKAYFETNGAWHNPTPYSQSYYYWSCAAIPTGADLKYVFPGRWQIGHNYDAPLEPWPLDRQGRDLSWYKNNAFGGSKSYFTVGEYQDFYGAWYRNADAGFGHWALYDDLPGRKVWIWDLSRSGDIWVDLLTDADGQYTEPQAGRLLNQSDHEFLRSGAADRWRELWFPYNGIGPMAKASPAAVLGVEEAGGTLKLGLYPLEAIDEDLAVIIEGKEIFRERLKLEAAIPFKKDVPAAAGRPVTVKLGERLVYESDPKADDVGRPLKFRDADEATAEGLFRSGSRHEKGRSFDLALEKYLACLSKEPTHLRALARTAELYTRRGEYGKALAYAEQALENEMYSPEANYVYGVIARRLGRPVEAKEAFGWAARSQEFRSAAYDRLAESALSEKKFDLAETYARRSIDVNKFDSSAYEILAAVHRKAGRAGAAKQVLSELLDFDPLDHLGRFELALLDPSPKNLEAFKSMIRNELPHESYIEMALTYMRWNCDDDAVAVLRHAPEYPTILYMLALLLRNGSPEESRTFLEKASTLSPRLVFPIREGEIPLYDWAITAAPGDWKPKYYLGLIYWGKGRIDEARALFAQSDGADFAPFFLTRAMLERSADPARAEADYVRAIRLDEKSWRSRHLLIDFQTSLKQYDKALVTARTAAERFPAETPLQVDLVKALMNTGRFAEAAAILETIEALPFEGASEIHSLFARTHIQLGVEKMRRMDWAGAAAELERSKEYPEKLGSGKPFDPDVRLHDYLLGLVYGKLGEKEKAEAAFRSVVDFTLKFPESRGTGAHFGALALRRAGRAAQAAEIMKAASPPAKDILDLIR